MTNKKAGSVFIFFFIIYFGILCLNPCVQADNLDTGIVLADDLGKILYSQNRQKQFIPASILKILTSLAVINILGEDFRFPTKYSFNENSKNLYFKGFGDPLFISEVIEQLCHEISLKTDSIHNIFIDQTYFANQIIIPGKGESLNPYDASIGALCANFNTIMFKWSPKEKRFVSAEAQTPLLDIFHKDIKKTNLNQGRIILTKQQSLLYPGFLIRYFLEKNNVKVTGSVLQAGFKICEGKEHTFLSPFEIKEVVQRLLKYSNNYIANLLLLSIGAKIYGAPATLEKGLKAIKHFSKQNLGLKFPTIFEGSGLSRSNKISPEQMLKILIKFMPFHSLLKQKGNEFYKTGTLSGVRTRAGYIVGNDKRLYPYVIMVNNKNKGYESIRRHLLKTVSRMTK